MWESQPNPPIFIYMSSDIYKRGTLFLIVFNIYIIYLYININIYVENIHPPPGA